MQLSICESILTYNPAIWDKTPQECDALADTYLETFLEYKNAYLYNQPIGLHVNLNIMTGLANDFINTYKAD